jgi:hypothetical protein
MSPQTRRELLMKVLVAILVVLGILLCLPVVIPIVTAGAILSFGLLGLFIWFLPILIIACSDKTTGGEKAAWILAIVFLSWFAWIFYFLLAPIKSKSDDEYRAYRYR